MPQIPIFNQNRVDDRPLPSVQIANPQDTRLASLSHAANAANSVFTEIRKEEQLKADRAAFMEADRSTDELSNSLYQRTQSRQLKDAIGSGKEALSEFDQESAKILQGLKTPRQQLAYRESLNQQRANLQRNVDTHERQQTESYYATERKAYAEQAHQNAVTYYTEPKRIEQEIAKQADVIRQTPGLSAEMKASETARLRSTTYADVIDRYLVNEQVSGAEAYYKAVKDKVGGEAATHIENSIRVTRDRIEARALALSSKREAAGLRAINKINEQIASGVPATPEMWKTWGATVKGTDVEGEFSSMQKDEADVQGMLRQPIADQVKFVQDKEAALKSGGGSIRELRNLSRLRAAVQQNIKMLNDAPIQFDAARTGTEVAPLDIAAVVNGDADANAQVIDRFNTLNGMRKQYGAVPMKVLLPQEAAQLSAALSTASPKQQSEVFGGLYKSMGNEAYQAAMQQIAPDSPVRSLAGMLSAKQAQMTTMAHWFKPNEIVNSGDVSATLLQGEELLNSSKADKKTDGKPKLSLYLPESNTLQASFQSQIGDAFAGRPAAADVAFQAIKSYYVGRAAQTGRIAASNQDIDSGLVKEAITATMGSVVDYNGADVLAPWGMDSSEFKDRAAGALSLLGDNVADHVTLRNAGDGTYYVTQGRNFVVDKDNKPVLIDVYKVPGGAGGSW